MPLEFRKPQLPDDCARLRELDIRLFGDDAFGEATWLNVETYWILLDGRVIGCTAFIHDVDFQEDFQGNGENVPRKGTLYILTTGILPEYRGSGLGGEIKAWQIEYAKHNGFRRIVTNCRESNSAILSLNRKYGFRVVRTTTAYYENPVECTVVMELLL